ncbi:MAG: MBL fold metallo-hydrolase [Pseudomonadota bacterium]
MSSLEILPDLFFIRRGYLNGNHFAFRSEDPVLIDTGYLTHFPVTEGIIRGLGVDISRTRLIVSTHGHSDHVGGNRIIQERSGCDIAQHIIGKHFTDTKDSWATWWRYYAQDAEFFNCTRALDDGDVLCIGPYEFEVIYTPGHSADGIVLFHRPQGLLVSSDTLWEHDMAVMTVRVEGSGALFSMRDSLERLKSLDVRTVCPGHGEVFTDFRGAIGRAEQRIDRFISDPSAVGYDLLKKIIVYTLMMKEGFQEPEFLPYLLNTPWFRETVDFYFDGRYDRIFQDVMEALVKKRVVLRADGRLSTTIEP